MGTAVIEIKSLSSLIGRVVDVPPSPPSRWPNQPDPLAKASIMITPKARETREFVDDEE